MIMKVFRRNFSSNGLPNHMKEFFDTRSKTKCFDQIFNLKWKVVEAPQNQGSCLFEIKVDESLVNINKTIHGGAIASLLDMTTTAALYNTTLRKPGVTVDMNISYLKPAKLNQVMLIDAQVIKFGSKMAFLEAKFYLKDENSSEFKKEMLIAKGSHTKFIN